MIYIRPLILGAGNSTIIYSMAGQEIKVKAITWGSNIFDGTSELLTFNKTKTN